jgi:hypothetical protein
MTALEFFEQLGWRGIIDTRELREFPIREASRSTIYHFDATVHCKVCWSTAVHDCWDNFGYLFDDRARIWMPSSTNDRVWTYVDLCGYGYESDKDMLDLESEPGTKYNQLIRLLDMLHCADLMERRVSPVVTDPDDIVF